jgi:hypothetical protein
MRGCEANRVREPEVFDHGDARRHGQHDPASHSQHRFSASTQREAVALSVAVGRLGQRTSGSRGRRVRARQHPIQTPIP